MGKRGPKRTPTALLAARGSWRAGQRKEDGEPTWAPYKHVPSPPAFLTGAAVAEWRRIAPMLVGQGVITPSDRAALTAYCQAWADMVQASAIIDACGMTCMNDKGAVTAHPAVRIRADAQRRVMSFAASFGLTPATRSEIRTNAKDEKPGELEAKKTAASFIRLAAGA